jgi:hypothetical protein
MDKERSGERMKLGAFFHPTGNHVAAWLHPDAQIDAVRRASTTPIDAPHPLDFAALRLFA